MRALVEERSDAAFEILQAAIADFDESGFSSASISSIAKRAGKSRSLVTYYFPTKAFLASAILNRAYPGGVFMGYERVAEDPLDAIVDAAEHVTSSITHGGLARVALRLRDCPELEHHRSPARYSGWFARITDYLDEARRAGLVRGNRDIARESRLLVAGVVGLTTIALQFGDYLSLVDDSVTLTRHRIALLSNAPMISSNLG